MTSWVNGRVGRMIDCRDRGLQYGDGVFETMRVRRGAIRFVGYHLERLAASCHRLGIALPNMRRLGGELSRVAARRRTGVMKLIVTRGIGPRGYRPGGHERCTRVISLHPLPRNARSDAAPVRLRLCTVRLGVNPTLGGLKTLNRLEPVLARAEWRDARIWEGLMLDTDDNIVCGTMSNLFVRQGSSLITPPVDRCGIAGVMRRWVLEQASALRLHAVERRLRWAELAAVDEVFMTNAVAGVVPVAVIAHSRSRMRYAARDTSHALQRLLSTQ